MLRRQLFSRQPLRRGGCVLRRCSKMSTGANFFEHVRKMLAGKGKKVRQKRQKCAPAAHGGAAAAAPPRKRKAAVLKMSTAKAPAEGGSKET